MVKRITAVCIKLVGSKKGIPILSNHNRWSFWIHLNRIWMIGVLILVFSQSPVFAGDIENKLSSADGSTTFEVRDSGDSVVSHIDSNGNMVIKGGLRLDSAGAECTTSENLIVDGNVGIGIGAVNPGEKLVVRDGNPTIILLNPVTGTDADSGIRFIRGGTAGTDWQIINTNYAPGDLRFTVDTNEDFVGDTIVMTLKLNGSVGIGETSPGSRLELDGSTSDSTAAALDVQNSGNSSLLYVRNDGNVGVGTASPDNLLSLNKASGDVILDFDIGDVDKWVLGVDDSDSDKFKIEWGGSLGGGVPAFVITPTGFIGMGTATPGKNLEIKDNDPWIILDDVAAGIGLGGEIKFQAAGINQFRIQSYGTADKLNIWTDDQKGITIDSVGKVGIGETSPGSRLEINGSTSDSTAAALDVQNSGNSSLLYVRNDGKVGIGETSPGSRLEINGSTSDNTAAALDVQNSGNSSLLYVRNDGYVGIGTNTPSGTLHVNAANGIYIDNLASSNQASVEIDLATGKLSYIGSSIRYKKDIRDLKINSEDVFKLRPVRFKWKKTDEEDIGLIAEEVNEVIPELVRYDKKGKPATVEYELISVYLLEVVNQQQQKISALEQRIAEIEKKLKKI